MAACVGASLVNGAHFLPIIAIHHQRMAPKKTRLIFRESSFFFSLTLFRLSAWMPIDGDRHRGRLLETNVQSASVTNSLTFMATSPAVTVMNDLQRGCKRLPRLVQKVISATAKQKVMCDCKTKHFYFTCCLGAFPHCQLIMRHGKVKLNIMAWRFPQQLSCSRILGFPILIMAQFATGYFSDMHL